MDILVWGKGRIFPRADLSLGIDRVSISEKGSKWI